MPAFAHLPRTPAPTRSQSYSRSQRINCGVFRLGTGSQDGLLNLSYGRHSVLPFFLCLWNTLPGVGGTLPCALVGFSRSMARKSRADRLQGLETQSANHLLDSMVSFWAAPGIGISASMATLDGWGIWALHPQPSLPSGRRRSLADQAVEVSSKVFPAAMQAGRSGRYAE